MLEELQIIKKSASDLELLDKQADRTPDVIQVSIEVKDFLLVEMLLCFTHTSGHDDFHLLECKWYGKVLCDGSTVQVSSTLLSLFLLYFYP